MHLRQHFLLQFLEPVTVQLEVTIVAVDVTTVNEEFVCLLDDCPQFEKLVVNKSILQSSFNMDSEPTPEDLRPCMPFSAMIKVKGINITECDILTVPDNVGLCTVDEFGDDVGLDSLSNDLTDNAVLQRSAQTASAHSNIQFGSSLTTTIEEKNLLYPDA